MQTVIYVFAKPRQKSLRERIVQHMDRSEIWTVVEKHRFLVLRWLSSAKVPSDSGRYCPCVRHLFVSFELEVAAPIQGRL